MAIKLVLLGNTRNTNSIGLLEDKKLKLNLHIVDRIKYHQFDLFTGNPYDTYDVPSSKERKIMHQKIKKLYDLYRNFNPLGISDIYVDWHSYYNREDYSKTHIKDIVLNPDKSFYSCSLWAHRENDTNVFGKYKGEELIDYSVAYAQFEKLLAAD